jgi:protein involved in polysaccharide export with SLBB domain
MFTTMMKSYDCERPLHRKILSISNLRMMSFAALVLCFGLGGCATSPNLKPLSSQDTLPQYHLGAGDRLSIVVFGEENMTGEYDVDDTGVVSVPLAGRIPVTGMTPIELEGAINTRLAKGLIANPRVAVSVVKYRPFYIIGEVQRPGAYPYYSGATVLSAVALAGGYTYRAKMDTIEVVRPDGNDRSPKLANQEAYLLPGDILIVPLRWF